MPVANLANIPTTPEQMAQWTFALQAQIRDINLAIYVDPSYRVALPEYSMDPLNLNEPFTQLIQFQQMANNISAILNIQGYDFEDVDLSNEDERAAWVWIVFTFLKQASDQLQVG